ncbi:hypothetical protein [Pseudomonas aeruginosa]|uniref:hypothetical protein n=1 Tax=Pseudomonas aeruginosa TaxID=287 RepID=UPI001480E99E|nr:hypothetical protein [Pseudomonas aeruginosa]
MFANGCVRRWKAQAGMQTAAQVENPAEIACAHLRGGPLHRQQKLKTFTVPVVGRSAK